MENLLDLGVILLFIGAVISLMGFILFLWEWKRKGRASLEFKCITLIFLFISYSNFLQFVARIYSNINEKNFLHLLDSLPWKLRSLPITIIITIIIVRIILKLIKEERS